MEPLSRLPLPRASSHASSSFPHASQTWSASHAGEIFILELVRYGYLVQDIFDTVNLRSRDLNFFLLPQLPSRSHTVNLNQLPVHMAVHGKQSAVDLISEAVEIEGRRIW